MADSVITVLVITHDDANAPETERYRALTALREAGFGEVSWLTGVGDVERALEGAWSAG